MMHQFNHANAVLGTFYKSFTDVSWELTALKFPLKNYNKKCPNASYSQWNKATSYKLKWTYSIGLSLGFM